MTEQQNEEREVPGQNSRGVERFLKTTFDKLPVDSKVLIGLFATLNSASSVTTRFDLPDQLWGIVCFGDGGPLVGQSEEVNWLKGVSDGILLMADHI
jgi:hypothetical protein